MFSGNLVTVLLAFGLSSLGVDAHRHGAQHQHHKRGDTDSCKCFPVTTTTWVPYVPSEWSTKTSTVVETLYVFVDIGDTATVTATEYDNSEPSGAWRVKRGIDVVPTSTAAVCGCYEKVITTWVPYEPEQIIIPYVASSVESYVYSSKVLPVSIPSIAPPVSSTYTPPAPAPVSSTYTPVADQGQYYQAPSPSSTSAAVDTYVPAPEGGLYCITYTPYDSKSGACKSASAILSDLAEIKAKGFPRIRLYGVDCNQLTLVAGPAVTMGFKVTLGVFFDGTGAVRGNADLGSILSWAQWSNIEVINIGNEAVSQGHISASGLVSFIQTAKTKLRAAGYNGVISTAEVVSVFQSNPSLCSCLDSTVSAQIHPFFDPNTRPSDAGKFVLSQIQLVKSACGGKTVIVSETGWPSKGATEASSSDQATAIASLKSVIGSADITFFSFTDDYWKKGPAIEQAFGLIDLF